MNKPSQRIAILIPCRNEARHIARCLDSLLVDDYPHDLLDIVVIDGMSDDGTVEVVRHYTQSHACIRLLENPKLTKPAALNLGITATDSEIVVRIDAHATYDPNYVSKLVAGLERHDADNIGGVRRTDPGSSTWQRAISLAVSHPFAAGNASYRTGVRDLAPRKVDTVFCGCYRRDVFHRIGGFHPQLLRTQDREFNSRLIAAGGKIILDPNVQCCYYPRTRLTDHMRWVFQGAFWVYYADRFTSTKMRSWRNWIPAMFVLWHAFALVIWLLAPRVTPIVLAPLVAYWLLAGICSFVESVRFRSWQLFPALMTLFPITHYSYGIGTLCGKVTCWLVGNNRSLPPNFASHLTSVSRQAA